MCFLTHMHLAGLGFVAEDAAADHHYHRLSHSHLHAPPPPLRRAPSPFTRKSDMDFRGSRAVGRRAPSGMHSRSHSVPVVPQLDQKRDNVVANKFGTWGVGSKAVTEDWNEDFDFDKSPEPLSGTRQQEEKRVDSGHEMFVPSSIREQQENVMANIGLLREWGLLIEELKDLRIQSEKLDLIEYHTETWHEIDAMIELADQESEEHTLQPKRSFSSSPGIDFSAFDEPGPNLALTSRPRGDSIELSETTSTATEEESSGGLTADSIKSPTSSVDFADRSNFGEPTTPRSSRQRRQSVKTPETILALGSPFADFPGGTPEPRTPQQFTSPTRPRKDSEAIARTVIEALQSKHNYSGPNSLKSPLRNKKVPFDTATLRHIVPYANGLKRKVRDALREHDRPQTAPHWRMSLGNLGWTKDTAEPAFRSIFDEPLLDDPVPKGPFSRREQATTDHDGFDDPFCDHDNDLAQRLQTMMSLPKPPHANHDDLFA